MGRTNHQLGLFSNEATFHQIQSLSDAQVADKGLLVHLPDSPGYQSCKAYAGFFFSFLIVSCCQWCPEVKDEHSLPFGKVRLESNIERARCTGMFAPKS